MSGRHLAADAARTLTLGGGRLLDGRAVDVFVDTASGTISGVLPAGELPPVGELARLDGRLIVPGLWDAHTHFTQWALASRRADLSGAGSAREAVALLAEHAAAQPDGAVIGGGFHDALWPDAPHRSLLDAVVPDRPVVAVSGDLHCVWLNGAALAEHGLTGHPDGVLREEEAFRVTRALDRLPEQTQDEWVAAAARAAAARGVVGVVDLEMAFNLPVWRRRYGRATGGTGSAGSALDAVPLRVEAGFYPQHLDAALAQPLRSGEAAPGTDGLLTMGALKVITDGSLNTRTAYCADPYPGLEDDAERSHGLLTVPPETLVPLLRTARANGFRVAVHAIGDRANALALDAFALTGAAGSIEHAQLLAAGDLARFAELGVVASVQPEHAMDDRDVADRYWAGRTGRAFPLRGLLDAGARLAFGSDAPVVPLDPWVAMSAAVGRRRDGRDPWHPEQAITLAGALTASTRNTIAPGQPADLAVIEAEPQALTASDADAEALRSVSVALTMLGARVTHQASSAPMVASTKIAAP